MGLRVGVRVRVGDRARERESGGERDDDRGIDRIDRKQGEE